MFKKLLLFLIFAVGFNYFYIKGYNSCIVNFYNQSAEILEIDLPERAPLELLPWDLTHIEIDGKTISPKVSVFKAINRAKAECFGTFEWKKPIDISNDATTKIFFKYESDILKRNVVSNKNKNFKDYTVEKYGKVKAEKIQE
jgi:hypothetical protein